MISFWLMQTMAYIVGAAAMVGIFNFDPKVTAAYVLGLSLGTGCTLFCLRGRITGMSTP